MPQRFVSCDSGCGGKVEGTEIGVGLRDCYTIFADFLMKPIGCAMAFIAKDEAIAIAVFHIPVSLLCTRGKEPESLRSIRAGSKSLPVVVVMQVEAVPVVHSAAPDLLIGNVETEWMNEMEASTGNRTQPTDVTGVLRDFGVKEDDVQHRRGLLGKNLPAGKYRSTEQTNGDAVPSCQQSLQRDLHRQEKTAPKTSHRCVLLWLVQEAANSLLSEFSCALYETGKGLRLEGGTTNEAAIDVFLSEECIGIFGLHGTAIKDADLAGSFFAE